MLLMWLLAACSAPPALSTTSPGSVASLMPLQVGNRWEYAFTRREGPEVRMLFVPIQRPDARPDGTLALELTKAAADGRLQAILTRTPASGSATQSALELWSDDSGVWMNLNGTVSPAITATVPSRVVSTEPIPCVVHVLGGISGICSPAPGGPLGLPSLPQSGVINNEINQGLGGAALGVITAFLVMTNEMKEVTAQQTASPPLPSSVGAFPQFERRSDSWLSRTWSPPPADAESVAALVHRSPERARFDILEAGLAALPEADRPVVLRATLEELSRSDYPRARSLALLRPLLPSLSPSERDALLAHASSDDERQMWIDVLDAPDGVLLATYAVAERVVDFAGVAEPAILARYPDDAVVDALVRVAGQPMLAVLARSAPPERRGALVTNYAEDLYGSDALALVLASPKEARALPKDVRELLAVRLDDPKATQLLLGPSASAP